jgi:NAD(P)-dependent dehydrogenase (short-subunit alcohol dehydrogenase family)
MARVLITGCSSGIGRATAIELARHGHEIIATARQLDSLDDLDVAMRLRLDVTDDSSVAAAVEAAGGVDVLVNNAGFSTWGPMEMVPFDLIASVMDTNYFGPLRMIRAVVPFMRQQRSGRIVNVSSVSGRVCGPLMGPYCASKHAVEALSEVLRFELRPFGIGVVVIEPGAIESEFDQNRMMFRDSDGPYRELTLAGEASLTTHRAAPASPHDVATVIAETLSHAEPKLRWTVGADAEFVTARRRQLSDQEWEDSILTRLGLATHSVKGFESRPSHSR